MFSVPFGGKATERCRSSLNGLDRWFPRGIEGDKRNVDALFSEVCDFLIAEGNMNTLFVHFGSEYGSQSGNKALTFRLRAV